MKPELRSGLRSKLRAENLSVRYDADNEGCALRGVTFSIRDGERAALLGANGAGKSTLLMTLVGVLHPESGEVILDDAATTKETLRYLRSKVGVAFQNPDDQLFMPSLYEDIAFGPRNYGLPEPEVESRVSAALSRLGISHLRERMTHRLSGGEKRLAALAGILVMEPSVLLMDEPTSFLDGRSRRRLIEILSGLPQAMIIATHDIDLASKLCERVILLQNGQIRADGDAETILSDAAMLDACGL
ncbi:cobalt ABC transporter ATP-binding protein [Synergistales bacterium]|nr:cobalt ABC transporter ATP-binding protein [Synergistales bacterium]